MLKGLFTLIIFNFFFNYSAWSSCLVRTIDLIKKEEIEYITGKDLLTKKKKLTGNPLFIYRDNFYAVGNFQIVKENTDFFILKSENDILIDSNLLKESKILKINNETHSILTSPKYNQNYFKENICPKINALPKRQRSIILKELYKEGFTKNTLAQRAIQAGMCAGAISLGSQLKKMFGQLAVERELRGKKSLYHYHGSNFLLGTAAMGIMDQCLKVFSPRHHKKILISTVGANTLANIFFEIDVTRGRQVDPITKKAVTTDLKDFVAGNSAGINYFIWSSLIFNGLGMNHSTICK